MENIITAKGKKFNCDYFNQFLPAAQVNFRVIGVPVYEVATVFSNAEETVQLWYGNEYLAHHTKLIAIVPERDAIRVVLGKE